MGLGPPVCVDCGVVGYLEERRGWRCPNCADSNSRSSWKYETLQKDKPESKEEDS